MKIEELLANRSEKNIVYDFSNLTRDELRIFVHSGIVGEAQLSDSEMQLLESAQAKIIERPGKPRKFECNFPEFNPDKDDAETWLRARIAWQQEKK